MLQKSLKISKFCFLPFINQYFGSVSDRLEQATKTEQSTDTSVAGSESGWDRIKGIFEIDEFGNLSYEANSVLQTGAMSLFVGAMYGGVMNSRTAYTEFMRLNEATSFRDPLEAKKKLQHAVSMSFAKGAYKFGWRLALFSTSFVGISTLIQVYRGKSEIKEYVAAGGITGVMYKFNMGPRGWIVGGGLGSILGLVCGGMTLAILKLTGISMEEARYWQYQWKHGRKEYLRKGMVDYYENEDFAIVKLHNDTVGSKGRHINNVDKSD